MNFYKCIGKSKLGILWLGVLLSTAALLIFSQECKCGCINGILMCLGILIPSLFPFFVISSFLAESRILDCLSPILTPISRILTGMRGVCFAPIIMACMGGYPVGAKSVASLYSKGLINKSEAERLSCICCGAGPGFLITFLGESLLCNKEAGIILLLTQIISMLILCLLSKIIFGKCSPSEKLKEEINITEDVSEALVNAVSSAVKSTVGMCSFVVLFSVISQVLTEGLNFNGGLGKFIISMLEITGGISIACDSFSLEVISLLTGFGGICVHMQIFRELKCISFSKTKFYIFRVVQAVLSYTFTKLLLLWFPQSQEVFSTVSSAPKLTFYSSILGSAALLSASMVFIIALRKKRTT